MSKKNIYVIYGNKSVEHEVSIVSAKTIINNLDREKYDIYPVFIDKEGKWIPLDKIEKQIEDVAELTATTDLSISKSLAEFLNTYINDENTVFFPIVHGTYGEDGCMQGLFECLDVPYVGNGVLSSAISFDKGIANDLFSIHNVPQGRYHVFEKTNMDDFDEDVLIEKIGLPMYVKPCNAGSSVGVSPVYKKEDIKTALDNAFKYDNRVVCEEEILGDELQVSVIGNEDPKASLPGGFIVETKFLDYNTKYHDDTIIPLIPYEKMSKEETEKIRQIAIDAYRANNCSGLARVDIFLREKDRALLVNEINSMPGMTGHSMTPVLWGVTDGTTYPELLDKLIDLAVDAYNKKNNIVKTLD